MTIKLVPGAKSTMKADGTVPILVYFSNSGYDKSYVNTGSHIKPEDWNSKGRAVKLPVPNSDLVNARINTVRNDIETLMYKNPTLTTKAIKAIYEKPGGAGGKETLLEFMVKHIADCKAGVVLRKGKELRSGTIKNYQTCLRNIKDFSDTHHIDFHLINESLYNSMIRYWRHEKKFSENFIGGLVKNFKVFLTDAFDKGLTTSLEHKKKYFAKPSQKVRHIYLNEIEILAIRNVKNLPEHLLFERDRFIVAYSLMLRYSDSVLITKDKFQKIDGVIYFSTTTVKTTTDVMLPVDPEIYAICEKNNFDFGKGANAEANWKIKEIGRLSVIKTLVNGKEKWEWMTTHTARRSRATNMVLAAVPKNIVMMMGGWRSEGAFNLYLCMGEMENAVLASQHPYFNQKPEGDNRGPSSGNLRIA